MQQLFDQFSEYIITGVIGLLGTLAGWWAGKRKTTAETEVVETDVIKSIRELYGNLVEDMKSTIDELKHTREQVEKLSKEIVILRDSVYTLEKDLDDCRKGITTIQNK